MVKKGYTPEQIINKLREAKAGVHCQGGEEMAESAGSQNALHRAGEPLRERIHRVIQRQNEG